MRVFLLGFLSLAAHQSVARGLAEMATIPGHKRAQIDQPALRLATKLFFWDKPTRIGDLRHAMDKMELQAASIGMSGLAFMSAGMAFLSLGIESAKNRLARERKKLRSKK